MLQTNSDRLALVAAAVRDRGFTLTETDWGYVAIDGPSDLAGVDAPLELVSLQNSRPLSVVSAVANAAHSGQVPVLVADDRTLGEVESILSEPFLLADDSADGRVFYSIEDRIQLSDGRFACAAATGPFEWRETGAESTDEPDLRLDVGGETIAAFDSVDGLTCPGPSASAFPHRYARGEDGQFRVFEGEQVVGQYTGIGAMRDGGFRPVPLPLVPEHHIRAGGSLARATVLAGVSAADETVSFRSV